MMGARIVEKIYMITPPSSRCNTRLGVDGLSTIAWKHSVFSRVEHKLKITEKQNCVPPIEVKF